MNINDSNIITDVDAIFAGSPEVDEINSNSSSDKQDDNAMKLSDEEDNIIADEKAVDDMFSGSPDVSQEVGIDDNSVDDSKSASSQKPSKLKNQYQELAKILKEEGVFTELDDDDLNEVVDSDSFKQLIDAEVEKRMDASELEVKHALELGLQPSEIQLYTQTINYLNNISEDTLTDLSTESRQLRVNIMYRDFLNRGFSEKKASSMAMASVSAGTDIEDAKEALESCKTFYTDRYNTIKDEAKQQEADRMHQLNKETEQLKKSLLGTDTLFDGINVDKNTRQKAFNNITQVYKTDENGNKLTAIQAYADEHPVEFRTAVSLLYTMTDGFTKFNKLFNKAVNKKVNSKLDDLTAKLSNQRNFEGDGNLRYKNGIASELIESGWKPLI